MIRHDPSQRWMSRRLRGNSAAFVLVFTAIYFFRNSTTPFFKILLCEQHFCVPVENPYQ